MKTRGLAPGAMRSREIVVIAHDQPESPATGGVGEAPLLLAGGRQWPLYRRCTAGLIVPALANEELAQQS